MHTFGERSFQAKGTVNAKILKQEGLAPIFKVNLIGFVDGLDVACRKVKSGMILGILVRTLVKWNCYLLSL